jgi:hypothetical protein
MEPLVWVALWSSQMDSALVGIFSDKDAAEKAANAYQKEEHYGDGYVECWVINGERIDRT